MGWGTHIHIYLHTEINEMLELIYSLNKLVQITRIRQASAREASSRKAFNQLLRKKRTLRKLQETWVSRALGRVSGNHSKYSKMSLKVSKKTPHKKFQQNTQKTSRNKLLRKKRTLRKL